MKSHRDLGFEVECGDHREHFKNCDKAMAHAFVMAATGRKVTFDVIASSRAAAKAWAGDDGVRSYDEDPEASVFERYELSINFVGRVA